MQSPSWEELCREHATARLEGDNACKAITAKLTSHLTPAREELERWDRACEQIVAVDGRMHRFVSTSLPTG